MLLKLPDDLNLFEFQDPRKADFFMTIEDFKYGCSFETMSNQVLIELVADDFKSKGMGLNNFHLNFPYLAEGKVMPAWYYQSALESGEQNMPHEYIFGRRDFKLYTEYSGQFLSLTPLEFQCLRFALEQKLGIGDPLSLIDEKARVFKRDVPFTDGVVMNSRLLPVYVEMRRMGFTHKEITS